MPNEIFFFFSSPRRGRVEFNDSSVESEESMSRDSRFASLDLRGQFRENDDKRGQRDALRVLVYAKLSRETLPAFPVDIGRNRACTRNATEDLIIPEARSADIR